MLADTNQLLMANQTISGGKTTSQNDKYKQQKSQNNYSTLMQQAQHGQQHQQFNLHSTNNNTEFNKLQILTKDQTQHSPMLFNSRRQQSSDVNDGQNLHPNYNNTLTLLGKNMHQQQNDRYYTGQNGKMQGKGKEY